MLAVGRARAAHRQHADHALDPGIAASDRASALDRRHFARRCRVTLLCVATGAARSSLLTLYAIPLAGIAVAFGSWWLVVLLAVVIGALGLLLGALTPQTYIGDP